MATTNFSGIGEKNSSRVLKPPGGGHSNIFGEPDACPIKPRPTYNQQNSSNVSFVVGTVDANEKVKDAPPPSAGSVEAAAPGAPAANNGHKAASNGGSEASAQSKASGDGAKRVPPGGFSSGFW